MNTLRDKSRLVCNIRGLDREFLVGTVAGFYTKIARERGEPAPDPCTVRDEHRAANLQRPAWDQHKEVWINGVSVALVGGSDERRAAYYAERARERAEAIRVEIGQEVKLDDGVEIRRFRITRERNDNLGLEVIA